VRSLLTAIAWAAFALLYAAHLTGCAAGPQIPMTSIVMSCTWHGQDGGQMTDNDCMQDRAEAKPTTTGNEVRDNTISPRVSTSVTP
jgi:hypothetical protein